MVRLARTHGQASTPKRLCWSWEGGGQEEEGPALEGGPTTLCLHPEGERVWGEQRRMDLGVQASILALQQGRERLSLFPKGLGWGAKRINQGNTQKCSLSKSLQITAGRNICQGPRGGSGEGTRRLFSFPASPLAGSAGSQAPRLSFTGLPLQTNTPEINTKRAVGKIRERDGNFVG